MASPEPAAVADLYRMLTWWSPAYPTGGFSYSHGLEYAVEAGLVADRSGLVAWVGRMLASGPGWLDAVLCARAHQAASADDRSDLVAIADLAAAWRGSAETALESTQQGAAFLAITRTAWPQPRLDGLAAGLAGRPLALPVALAVCGAAHGLTTPVVVLGCLHGFAANLVSAGVRLVPLGQTDGQRALAELLPVVADAAARALTTSLDDVGSDCPMVDWTCLKHETQYTRLFRS